MKLRVVTATKGESPYWAETVTSVAACATPCQHVVVCPESRRDALKIAPSLYCLVEEKRGLYPTLNQALRAEGEDWDAFTWINDDDVLRAPGFRCALRRLECDSLSDIIYGEVEMIDGQSVRLGFLPVAKRESDLCSLFNSGIIPFAQPGTIIRRTVWERLGGLDESYQIVGDMDFFIRALAAGVRFKHVDAVVAAFRLRAGQLSKSREIVADETRRALLPIESSPKRRWARARFRIDNLPLYLRRIRQFGWISMRQLYDRTT